MSAIDTVYHEVIGQIDGTPIYRLKEDVPDHLGDFDGKKGDILLGGGGGEAAAMRILMPETLGYWTDNEAYDVDAPYPMEVLVKTHWTNNDAYEFIKQYIALGYEPSDCPVETWLTEHILSYLLQTFPDEYMPYVGSLTYEDGEKRIDYDGSVCAAPEQEWVDFVKDWFKHREA